MSTLGATPTRNEHRTARIAPAPRLLKAAAGVLPSWMPTSHSEAVAMDVAPPAPALLRRPGCSEPQPGCFSSQRGGAVPRSRFVRAALFLLLLSAAPVAARGEEEGVIGKFFKGAKKAVEQMVDKAVEEVRPAKVFDVEIQDRPDRKRVAGLLKQVLANELAYVRKVCEPDEAQMRQIRKDGLTAVDGVAQRIVAAQAKPGRSGTAQIPEPRKLLTEALQKSVSASLPKAKAERYAEELAGREAAKREAGLSLVTTHIDRAVFLSPAQYDAMTDIVRKHWKPEWSRNPQILFYSDYLPFPAVEALAPVMTANQKSIWSARPPYGQISFGWEADLGFGDGMGGLEDGEELMEGG